MTAAARAYAAGAGTILLVDDDRGMTQALARHLAGTRSCVTASTCREARDRLVTGGDTFCGFIFDERLPDGRGLDLLRTARDSAPSAPALLLTGHMDAESINLTYALGGSCVLKPIGTEQLRRFVAEAVATDLKLDETLRRRVVAYAHRYKLTVAATETLVAKVAGYTTDDILVLRGVAANTYKTHVRQILHRTQLKTFEDVRRDVLGFPPATAPSRARLVRPPKA